MPPKKKSTAAAKKQAKAKSSQQSPERSQSLTAASASPAGKKKKASNSPGAGLASAKDRTPLADVVVNVLMSGGAGVHTAVDRVLALYQQDDASAIAAVVTAVARIAGVTGATFDGPQVGDLSNVQPCLGEALERVPADLSTFVLVDKEPEHKKVKKAFPDFFELLMDGAYGAEVLFDDVFMATLVPWLSAMGESKARNFRHTANVALFAMVRSLARLIAKSEEATSAAKSRKDIADAQSRTTKLTKCQADVFAVSLHNRFKDVSAEIRLLAFQTLRALVLEHPAAHLNNRYLRYLVIAIYDKTAEIRIEALDLIVQALGTLKQHRSKMQDFLKGYRARLVEMASDVNTKCADIAVKAAALIVKTDGEAGNNDDDSTLSHQMVDEALLAIVDDRAAIRVSGGKLLQVFIRCRIATDGVSDEKLLLLRANMLCSFAHTLRAEFGETLAESYIVESLWHDNAPPGMLTKFQPFFAIIKDDETEPEIVATALRLLSAVLARIKGPAELGPAAKDDIKVPAAKNKGNFDAEECFGDISAAAVDCLADALSQHDDAEVVAAVATFVSKMGLDVFRGKTSKRFKEFLDALRPATLKASGNTVEVLGKAWSALGFSDYPLRTDGESALRELLKQTLKQLSALDKPNRKASASTSAEDAAGVWQRIAVLSSLFGMSDQWGLCTAAMTQHVFAKTNTAVIGAIGTSLVNGVMWKMADAASDPTVGTDEVAALVSDAVPLFTTVAAFDSEASEQALALRCTALSALFDLLALPHHDVAVADQQAVLDSWVEVMEQVSEVNRVAHEALKDAVKSQAGGEFTVPNARAIVEARRAVSEWDATAVRLSSGISRLFSFSRFDDTLAPAALTMWTKTPVKTAGDVFKTLFHAVRGGMAGDQAAIERNILLAGHRECQALGASHAALEQFYQLGAKLASMHFLTTDTYYPCAINVVNFAVDLAASDDLMLHAAAPYCCRLRQPDALNIAQGLALNEAFASSESPYVRAFISAIRRAAKLDGDNVPRVSRVSGATVKRPSGTTAKRGRTTGAAMGGMEEDSLLADIVRDSKNVRASARTIGTDGWRNRGSAATPASQTKVKQPSQSPAKKAVTATQSSVFDQDEEVFIETQEWN
jgi:hypothetical protein